MVCFNHCLLPAVTSGSSSCLSSASGMTSKEKASPLLSTAVLFGSVVESLTTDGLWEKHSNNWTLCDHESFEELWHLNVFQQSSCKLLFISVFTLKLILIMCTFDFKKNYWYCLPSLCDLKKQAQVVKMPVLLLF